MHFTGTKTLPSLPLKSMIVLLPTIIPSLKLLWKLTLFKTHELLPFCKYDLFLILLILILPDQIYVKGTIRFSQIFIKAIQAVIKYFVKSWARIKWE